MVGSHEFFTTFRALESFFSRVSPPMSLEFIGSGESFPAEQPGTDERSFTGMPPEMRSKMRGFSVYFITTGNMAYVLFFSIGMTERDKIFVISDGVMLFFISYRSPSLQFGQVHATLRTFTLIVSVWSGSGVVAGPGVAVVFTTIFAGCNGGGCGVLVAFML